MKGGIFINDCIKTDNVAISCFTTLSSNWKIYSALRNNYTENKERERTSVVSEHIKKVELSLSNMLSLLETLVAIKPNNDMSFTTLSTTFLKKADALKNVLSQASQLNHLLEHKDFLKNIRKRINEREKNKQVLTADSMIIKCLNDTNVTWDFVNDFLVDAFNSRTLLKPYTAEELMVIHETISSNITMFEYEIGENLTPSKINQIIELFPVIYVNYEKRGLFINLHECVYTPGVLDFFLEETKNVSQVNIVFFPFTNINLILI